MDILGESVLGRQGRVWEFNRRAKEYQIKEGIPPLDSAQELGFEFALTADGYLYNLQKNEIYDFTPPLKQFISMGYPILFAISRNNELVRVSLRSGAYQIIKEGVTYLLNYRIEFPEPDQDNRRRRTKRPEPTSGSLDVIDQEGFHLKLTLNDRLDKIIKVEKKEYVSSQIWGSENDFLFTADGLFSLDVDGDHQGAPFKIEAPPRIISTCDFEFRTEYKDEDYAYCIMLLDENGNLFTGYHHGDRQVAEFILCESDFVIERNETDPWVKFVHCEEYGLMGLVGTSGRISLIDGNFSIRGTNLPIEIYGSRPSTTKSARNVARKSNPTDKRESRSSSGNKKKIVIN